LDRPEKISFMFEEREELWFRSTMQHFITEMDETQRENLGITAEHLETLEIVRAAPSSTSGAKKPQVRKTILPLFESVAPSAPPGPPAADVRSLSFVQRVARRTTAAATPTAGARRGARAAGGAAGAHHDGRPSRGGAAWAEGTSAVVGTRRTASDAASGAGVGGGGRGAASSQHPGPVAAQTAPKKAPSKKGRPHKKRCVEHFALPTEEGCVTCYICFKFVYCL
jgi:hypothetical protein